eukprot:jgi/Hompol1/1104/HPOL_005520-RA
MSSTFQIAVQDTAALASVDGLKLLLALEVAGATHKVAVATNPPSDWIGAKVDSFAEWDLKAQTELALTSTATVTDAAVAAALAHIEEALNGSAGFKNTSPAAVILFASLYRIFSSASNRKEISAKFPTTSAWFTASEKYPSYIAGVNSWKKTSSDAAKSSGTLPPPKVDEKCTIVLDHHERKILPKKGSRNLLITSALPYANNIPHLGNLIGSTLSADVFARYARLRGDNVLYICGTDEYGTATETKAIEEKMSCRDLCDKYFKYHKETYEWFGIDFDEFGHTATPKQTEISQDIFLKLEKKGFVMENSVTQLYCNDPAHQAFLADRFVEGICPLCGFEDARGDQCDGCGKLINAIELVKPRCKLDGTTPIPRDSTHLFLNLTDLQSTLQEWFHKTSVEGFWSSNSLSITNSWLEEGLLPRCITRDLKWGTPVPRKGYEKKVFYVWFDAPIGYLSITANYTKDWEKWWKNPEDVKLYQFMGKDNVPFHTVIFPSTLLGTDEKWTYLHHLSTTEYLQYEDGKFSKSRGVGVFGDNVMASGIPPEVWRYYLFSVRPESSDSQFLWASLIAANNNELLANFGNFVNRILKFINAKYDGEIPEYKVTDQPEVKLIEDVNALLAQYIEALEGTKIRQGLRLFMEISARGNQYLQENKIDNNLFANSRARCDNTVATAANLVYLLSALVYPYMPTTSAAIIKQLNLPQRRITDQWTATDILPGHQI